MKQSLVLLLLLLFTLGANAQMEILRVLPAKINYKLNEDTQIAVTVANRGSEPDSAELQLFDRWNLTGEKKMAEQKISLAPGEEKTFLLPWNTGTVRYGHEAKAVLRKDGKAIAAKSEFFSVINEWWRVNIGITPNVVGGTEQGDRLCAWYGLKPYNTKFSRFYHDNWGDSPIGPFASYFNNTTPWNMAFSTYGVYYDPEYKENDVWYAGEEQRTYADFKKDTELSKKWGVHRTMFTISCATTHSGFELARKHPQFFLKDSKGDFRYNVPVDPIGLSLKGKPYTAGWSYLVPDFTRKDVWTFSMDALIDGLKHLGQDGVYFDGAYRCHDGYDYEGNYLRQKHDFAKIERELSAYINQRLRDYNPDIYFWVNNGEGGDFRNILSNPASGTLWELNNFHHMSNHPLNLWNAIKESAVNVRNGLWKTKHPDDVRTNILHIGYSEYPDGLWYTGPSKADWAMQGLKYKNFAPSHQYWSLNSHVAAIIAAVGGHPYGAGVAFRPFSQVMTAYSNFYWDEKIELVGKAFRKFKVDSLREIWWSDFVYTKQTPEYTDWYIHLVNKPDQERHSFETLNEPKFAKGVEVSSRMFKNPEKLQVWAIQPYGLDSAVLEPVVTDLTPKKADGESVFEIPPFRYYTLLVIREKK